MSTVGTQLNTFHDASAMPKALTSDARNTASAPKADLVDINSATAAELKMLPGVSDSQRRK